MYMKHGSVRRYMDMCAEVESRIKHAQKKKEERKHTNFKTYFLDYYILLIENINFSMKQPFISKIRKLIQFT